MRRGKGAQIGLRRAIYGAANNVVREEVRAMNPKFHPGKDPIELEPNLKVIMPTERARLGKLTEMLEKTYSDKSNKAQQQALELWKFNVAQGTFNDQVNLDFMRRFYFWLLGRGEQQDHDKTLWGRANAAVYNKEVASYIDMFIDKRTEYIMKLLSLANNVPDSLNGYYLYFKYIVNGALKQVKAADGTINYNMSDEDYLQDFDMFQQVFDKQGAFGEKPGAPKYSDLAAPMGGKDFGKNGVPPPVNENTLRRKGELPPGVAYKADLAEEADIEAVDSNLHISAGKQKKHVRFAPTGSRLDTPVGYKRDDPSATGAANATGTTVSPGGIAVATESISGGTPQVERELNFDSKEKAEAFDEPLVGFNEAVAREREETPLTKDYVATTVWHRKSDGPILSGDFAKYEALHRAIAEEIAQIDKDDESKAAWHGTKAGRAITHQQVLAQQSPLPSDARNASPESKNAQLQAAEALLDLFEHPTTPARQEALKWVVKSAGLSEGEGAKLLYNDVKAQVAMLSSESSSSESPVVSEAYKLHDLLADEKATEALSKKTGLGKQELRQMAVRKLTRAAEVIDEAPTTPTLHGTPPQAAAPASPWLQESPPRRLTQDEKQQLQVHFGNQLAVFQAWADEDPKHAVKQGILFKAMADNLRNERLLLAQKVPLPSDEPEPDRKAVELQRDAAYAVIEFFDENKISHIANIVGKDLAKEVAAIYVYKNRLLKKALDVLEPNRGKRAQKTAQRLNYERLGGGSESTPSTGESIDELESRSEEETPGESDEAAVTTGSSVTVHGDTPGELSLTPGSTTSESTPTPVHHRRKKKSTK